MGAGVRVLSRVRARVGDVMGRTFHAALADEIVARVVAELRERKSGPDTDRWLTARDAATYLGLTVTALHKLTSARSVPFAQDTPGGKLWFKASDLDAWRYGGK